MEERDIKNSEVKIKHPNIEMISVVIKEIVVGEDGKIQEVEKIVMLPKFPKGKSTNIITEEPSNDDLVK